MSHLNFFIFILKKESNWEGEWTLLNVATFLRALKEYFSMTLYLPLPPPIEMVEIEKKIVSDHHPCLNLFYTGTDAFISFIFFKAFSRALLFCVSQTKFTRTLGLVKIWLPWSLEHLIGWLELQINKNALQWDLNQCGLK